MISVLILTKDEAHDIALALRSVSRSDDIHVFDSGSTDETIHIAREYGAKVTVRAFTNYADQRNAALREIPYRYEWVLILDADERSTDSLWTEIEGVTRSSPEEFACARLSRHDYLYGKWLKHAQITPRYIRLVRPGRVHYEREINEVLVPDGKVLELKGYLEHYPFSKGIAHWLSKHNRYSTMEAIRVRQEKSSNLGFSYRTAFLNRDASVRRRHQKGLFMQMPLRPFWKFVYMMVCRRSFLDGKAGWTYTWLQVFYEYMIVCKEREIDKD